MDQEPGNKGNYITAVIIISMLALASFLYFAFPDDKWFGIPLAAIFLYYRIFLEPKWKKKHAKSEEETEVALEEEVVEDETAEEESEKSDEEIQEEEEAVSEEEEEETARVIAPSGISIMRLVLGIISVIAVGLFAVYKHLMAEYPDAAGWIRFLPVLAIVSIAVILYIIVEKQAKENKGGADNYAQEQKEIVEEWEDGRLEEEEEEEEEPSTGDEEALEETTEDEETEEEEATGDDKYAEEDGHENARELSYNELSGSSAGRDDFLTHVANNIRVYGIILSLLIAGAYVYFNKFAGKQHINGENRDYYENTNSVKETYQVVNGKKEGPFKRFDRFGNLEAEGSYKNGKLDGLYVKYHPNGALQRKSVFVDGGLSGIETFYDTNGNIMYQEPVESTDKPVIALEKTVNNDEPELEGFIWSSFLKSRRENQNGYNWEKKGLLFRRTYENGKIMEEGQYLKKVTLDAYEKYLPDGTWKYYNENGKLYMEKVYEKGNPVKTLHYDNTGKVIGETP